MIKSISKILQAVALSCVLAGTVLGSGTKKDKCLGNHGCKRVFYLLSDYTLDQRTVDKKKFQKMVNRLSSNNVVVYQVGQLYQVYVPHESLYFKGSANLVKNSNDLTNVLSELIDIFKPPQVQVRGIIADAHTYDPNKPALDPADLARKQARVLVKEVKKKPNMRQIEFIDGESIRAAEDLSFWKIIGDSRAKTFTLIEFAG
jgi:hypothetical protein